MTSSSCGPVSSQNRDGSYTGFIKVQFQLARPISLPPSQRLSFSSSSTFCSSFSSLPSHGLCTSFYLPWDTAKQLHISSHTRVREVIEALLNKFTVVDNPAKFALFERSERNSQGEEHAAFLLLLFVLFFLIKLHCSLLSNL